MASNFQMKLAYYRNNPYKSNYFGSTNDLVEVNCDLFLNGHKLARADVDHAYTSRRGHYVGHFIKDSFTGTVLLPKTGIGNHQLTFEAGRLVQYS